MTDLTRDELRQQWLDALRSGEYEQTKYRLREGEAFCCLGVLCDVYDSEAWEGDDYPDAVRESTEDGPCIHPPDYIGDAVGLEYDDLVELTDYNDGNTAVRHDFEEIADVLERWFEEGDDG